MDNPSRVAENNELASANKLNRQSWFNVLALFIWLVAAAVAFLPFAFDTSPWDAVTLRVPGNQGNWWHVLVGVPFFLAYPMIWLRVRALFSRRPLRASGRRVIWSLAGFSILGTVLVETPFLLHLAGTRGWPRLSMLGLGFGTMMACGVLLFLRRNRIALDRACLVGLNTAYLANAALCLVVYSGAAGSLRSRLGWLITMVIVWPIIIELMWLFAESFLKSGSQKFAHAV